MREGAEHTDEWQKSGAADREPPRREAEDGWPDANEAQPRDDGSTRDTRDASDDAPEVPPPSDVWQKHPDEYTPATPAARDKVRDEAAQASTTRDWIEHINPDKELPGRQVNCADCTRVTESTWRGSPEAAAERNPIPGEGLVGEELERTEEWAGRNFESTTFEDVGRRLEDLGSGSSAMVAVEWEGDAGGHMFNAVNEDGSVRCADGQKGEVEPWPPSWSSVAPVKSVRAIVRER